MAKNIGAATTTLSLPSGTPSTGGLGESFSPDLYRGTGNMTVPIDLPPGENGVTPELEISYSSGRGNGPLGMGFSMGQMMVQRSTDRGVPSYGAKDADIFLLAGNDELVPVGEGRYRPMTEQSFWHIQREDTHWRVTTQDGTAHVLGGTPNSRIFDPQDQTRIFAWLLERTIDGNGIEINFRYQEDGAQRYLEEIAYSIFKVEFEYDDARLDSFVSRRAGFEVGTEKRLVQIRIVSTRDGGRTVLRRYDFSYSHDPLRKTSLMQSVSLSAGEGDAAQEMPVLRMGYSELSLTQSEPQELASTGGDSELPDLDNPNVSLVDLSGDGLPDIVATTATGTYVWRNMGEGNWAAPSKVEDLPGQHALGDAVLQFADLEGNGTLDLLIQDGPGSGFLRNDASGTWQRFQAYGEALPFDVTDVELRLIDVDGDGRIDAIRSADDALEIFTNNGPAGWSAQPLRIPRIHDKDEFPDVFFSNPRIHFADMTGDGLIDIIEVGDRDVSYWPYLGRGQYGYRHTMEHPPDMPAGIPVENLELIDLVGDGTADLVLTEPDRITIWLNHDGRRFGDPVVIDHGPQTRGARTYLVDVSASGRSGILYNRKAAGGTINRYGFIPLGDSQTAFLMNHIDNGMGSVTEMTYVPVESMRGPARRAGNDWPSFLPFPQQVLESIRVRDAFVSAQAVARFRYGNGHYNGERREFRGFGKVTETEEGDIASPRIVRDYIFDVGDDLGLTEPERRERPLTERIYNRARSGLPVSMKLSTRPESGGPLNEKERMNYHWELREEVADPTTPVLAVLEKSVLALQHSMNGSAQAELNTTQAYDDQGNKTSATVSFGKYNGAFAPEKTRKTEIRYASGPPKADGWSPRAIAEIRITNENDELIEHNRHYYDGPVHQGSPLGEMTRGNLTRIEDCMLQSDLVIQESFPGVDLEALGFHRSTGTEGWWRNTMRVERDALGRVTEVLDPMGHPHRISYDSSGLHVVRVVNAVGHVLEAEIDPNQEAVSSVTNPSGMKEQQVYDALGRVIALLHFDADGNPYCRRAVRHDRPDFSDGVSIPAQTISLRPNCKMSYEELSVLFDAGPEGLRNVRKSVIRVAGTGHAIEKRSSREVTADGSFAVALSGAQSVTPRGLTKSACWPRVASGFEWDGKVEPLETDPQFTFSFDHRGRTLEAREPGGKLRLTKIDPWFSEQSDLLPARGYSSRVRREQYTADGRLLQLDEDATGASGRSVVRYWYEKGGALARLSVNGTPVVGQEVNLAGQVLRNRSPEAGARAFLYDAAGNLVKSLDPEGVILENRYDAINRLTHTFVEGESDPLREFFYDRDPEDPAVPNLIGRVATVRDEAGQQSYRYDILGNIIKVKRRLKDGKLLAMTFEHDELGQLVRLIYPNGHSVAYDYNEGDLVRSIEGLIDEIVYAADGQPQETRFTNGVTTRRQFDLKRQMSRETIQKSSGEQISDTTFDYDYLGNVTSLTHTTGSQVSPQNFSYDALLRLTQVRGSAQVAQKIEYDLRGNITAKSDLGPEMFEYGEPDAPSRLTRYPSPTGDVTLQYDAGGRVINHTRLGNISYDYWGRPLKCATPDGTIVEYEFGNGDVLVARHVTKNGQRSSSYFLGGLYEESDGLSICSVISDGHLVGRVFMNQDGSSSVITHHADLQGSVYLMTDGVGDAIARQDFDPWGRAVDSASESIYIGRSLEQELGLILLGTRLYDPAIGRFLSPDDLVLNRPEGFSHGSQLLNPYAYGVNNPVRFRDPSGRFAWIPLIIGAVVGAYLGYQTARENGSNPWVGALIGAFIGAFIGGYGGYAMLGAAAKGAAISGGMNLVFSGGEGFWTSVSVGFVFGAIGSAVPDGVVAGKGAWVNTQNIAIEVGRGALLGGAQGAVEAQLKGEDAWDGFTKGFAAGAIAAGARIAVMGVRYDALSGPDPEKHGFARKVYDQYKVDTAKDNSRLAWQIEQEGVPHVEPGTFRRGGLWPRYVTGGRSMVFGNNVMMAPGQEYNVNVVAHELRHIHQIQLHGSFVGFLKEYWRQFNSPAWEFRYTTSPWNTTYEVHHN